MPVSKSRTLSHGWNASQHSRAERSSGLNAQTNNWRRDSASNAPAPVVVVHHRASGDDVLKALIACSLKTSARKGSCKILCTGVRVSLAPQRKCSFFHRPGVERGMSISFCGDFSGRPITLSLRDQVAWRIVPRPMSPQPNTESAQRLLALVGSINAASSRLIGVANALAGTPIRLRQWFHIKNAHRASINVPGLSPRTRATLALSSSATRRY